MLVSSCNFSITKKTAPGRWTLSAGHSSPPLGEQFAVTQDPCHTSGRRCRFRSVARILQRYLQVVDVIASAVDALAQPLQIQSEPSDLPPQPTPESLPGVMSIERRGELQTIVAFQQRLSEVLGVATVALEGSDDHGFRFLVEMEKPPY